MGELAHQTIHLYLFRGLAREHGHWGDFTKIIQERIPQLILHSLDLPGSGLYFKEKSPIRIQDYVHFMRQDFLKVQKSALPTDRHVFFALSLGAMIAVNWSILYPNDFSSGILLNTSLPRINPFFHRMRPQIYPLALSCLLAPTVEQREKLILDMVSNVPERRQSVIAEWIDIQKKRPVGRLNTLNMLRAAASCLPPKNSPLSSLLFLGSEKDRMVDVACTLAIQKKWGGSLAIHPSAGHDITLDEPRWVADRLKEWLEQQGLLAVRS